MLEILHKEPLPRIQPVLPKSEQSVTTTTSTQGLQMVMIIEGEDAGDDSGGLFH